jgi:hypothetical protein
MTANIKKLHEITTKWTNDRRKRKAKRGGKGK